MKRTVTRCSLVVGLSIACTTQAAMYQQNWQLKKIFSPTSRDLVRFAGNRMLFDGLRDTAIEGAPEYRLERVDTARFACAVVIARSGTTLRDKSSGRCVAEDG